MNLLSQFVRRLLALLLIRPLARYRLRQAGYCPRHLIQRTTSAQTYRRAMSEVYAGTIIPTSLIEDPCRMLDLVDPAPFCVLCREEKSHREQERLNRALDELGGKLR